MKHRSVTIYFLIRMAKTCGNSIWRAVLVGRYPRGREIFRFLDPWRPMEVHSKKINKGDFGSQESSKS